MLVLVAVLAGLLALLAVLQYRWLGQVSQGERERMQASLRAGAARFSQDFNREITRAYLTFQIEPDVLSARNWDAYAERYDRWDKSAPFPSLVSAVYLLERDKVGEPELSKFNRDKRKFELVEWPTAISPLRANLSAGFASKSGQHVPLSELALNPIAAQIPALVSPIVSGPDVYVARRNGAGDARRDVESVRVGMPGLIGYVIVKIDADVIRQNIAPLLTTKYFSGVNGLDYNVSIVDPAANNKVIYQSNQGSGLEPSSGADAKLGIFDVQMGDFDMLFYKGLPRTQAGSGDSVWTMRSGPPGQEVTRSEESTTSNGAKSTTKSRSVTVRLFNGEKSDGSTMQRSALPEPGKWQLLIQHRAGSLEAAVTMARRRNLLASFGVLLLLAASMALILIYTRRSQKLATRQLEFVSSVTHEFRTPLAVICSAGENLADGIVDAPQQVEKYGDLIKNEGRRLTGMVEQMLEFAGARSGRKGYDLRPVEVATIIEEALEYCNPLVVEKSFLIDKEIQPDLPLVNADPAALGNSLQNLLNNAMKYSGDRRWIGIRATTGENGKGKEVRITVEDKGRGIEASELPHIFEPFYRGRDVVAAQIRGNGLGLSLVKQIMESHRGKVTVTSEAGVGSSFTLHLPVSSGDES